MTLESFNFWTHSLLVSVPSPHLAESERERIGVSCDGLPLAIRWTLSRCSSAAEALALADKITSSNRHGEELLEFCFRRIFDAMSGSERAVLQVLALFQRPVTAEVLLVGSGVPQFKLVDTTEDLIADSVAQRLFDSEANDYSYTLLPITRAFVRSQMARELGLEDQIRRRLANYFEARDIVDPKERVVVRELRQGKGGSETALVDLAMGAERRGDTASAKALYEQALSRNPTSRKAARQYAEFNRHKMNNTTEALRLYELAAGNGPVRFARIISLLEPLKDHPSQKTQEFVRPLLLLAYERTGELLKAAALKAEGVHAWKY
jgi:tetratricopeptide (TPR) repeat protein